MVKSLAVYLRSTIRIYRTDGTLITFSGRIGNDTEVPEQPILTIGYDDKKEHYQSIQCIGQPAKRKNMRPSPDHEHSDALEKSREDGASHSKKSNDHLKNVKRPLFQQ